MSQNAFTSPTSGFQFFDFEPVYGEMGKYQRKG
jgi:hypothetical protein